MTNGSFEAPYISVDSTWGTGQSLAGWTVDSGTVNLVGSYFQAADGRQSVDLNGDPGPGALHQDVATAAGVAYHVRFALAGHPAVSSFAGCDHGVKQMSVEWNSTTIATLSFDTSAHSLGAMGWQYHDLDVVAQSASSRLRFVSRTPGYCGAAVDDVSLVRQSPPCEISDVAVVPQNGTRTVAVQSDPGTAVDLEVVRIGNGQAVFDNGSPSLTVTGPATAVVRGVQASSITDDTAIVGRVHGDICDIKRFTVLDVRVSLNTNVVTTSDNAAAPLFPYFNDLGQAHLGVSGAFVPVEIVGAVRPSGFDRNVMLKRVVNARSYKNGVPDGFSRPGCGGAVMVNGFMAGLDTSCPDRRDDDPRPNGRVYDTDAPGVILNSTTEALPVGTLLQYRANFYEFAVIPVGGTQVRVSDVLNWYVRVSVRKVDPTRNFWALDFSRPGDNIGSVGLTNLAP